MWLVCFVVFIIPTAIFTALGLLGLLIYGGEGAEDRAARIVHRLLSPHSTWEQFERILVSQPARPASYQAPPCCTRRSQSRAQG